MSKHDLQARPIYHHKRDSIEAHLTIVFAALAVTRWIETPPAGRIKKFVRTARRYRTIEIQAGAPHPHRRRPATTTSPRRSPTSGASVRTNLTSRAAELGDGSLPETDDDSGALAYIARAY